MSRIDAIAASASANVSRTTGSRSRSALSIPTYCEPWPVQRNATFGAGPLPEKTPLLRSIFTAFASFASNACAAFAAFSARSRASEYAIATRCGAPRSRGASAFSARSLPISSAALDAPTTATPLTGSDAGTCTGCLRESRPGSCSSRTMWKFVPPNPNALTAARRGSPSCFGNSRASRGTWKLPNSIPGFGFSKCRLGGMTFSRSAKLALSSPAAPAAALRWPMFDFTDPSATGPSAPNVSCRHCTSTTSPTFVDVPWPSTIPHVRGDSPAAFHARSMASFWPSGLGAVRPLPLPSLEAPTARITE